MEKKQIAIQITGVTKQYRLGEIGGGTLQAELQSFWAKLRGKEDPNTKLANTATRNKIFHALNGIDLAVYKGETLGILGRNGAGKSTLLKLLSRITAPTAGEIGINGRIASMLEVGTGFHREMTGRENIYMNGAILGMSRREVDEKLEAIIDFSEVREFIDTPVKRYSSGMYVKLAFAVAAHLDSEIMIMDEVLAVGDMAFQKKCLAKMREAAQQQGRTVLYVSHNMNTIRQLCSRCIVLDQGRIIFDGDTETGISVYMNNGAENCKERDVSALPRTGFTQKVHISQIALTDENHLCIEYEGFEDLEEAKLLLQLRSAENTPVGIAVSAPLAPVRRGGKYRCECSFDTSHLINGKYHISAGLFQGDENSCRLLLDFIPRALHFEHRSAALWTQQQALLKFPELEILRQTDL